MHGDGKLPAQDAGHPFVAVLARQPGQALHAPMIIQYDFGLYALELLNVNDCSLQHLLRDMHLQERSDSDNAFSVHAQDNAHDPFDFSNFQWELLLGKGLRRALDVTHLVGNSSSAQMSEIKMQLGNAWWSKRGRPLEIKFALLKLKRPMPCV